MPAGSSRTRSGSSSNRSATSAIGVGDRTRTPRSSVSWASSAPDQAAQGGGGAAHRHRSVRRRRVAGPRTRRATCLRSVSSSATDGRVAAQVAVGQEAGADAERLRPVHAPRPGAPTAISVEPPPTSTTAMVPGRRLGQRAGGADEREPRLLLAASAPAAAGPGGLLDRGHAARRGWRRCGSAAVATRASSLGAHLARASAPASPTTSAVSSTFSGGIARPCRGSADAGEGALGHELAQRPPPASATSSRVVLLPMSMQPRITRSPRELGRLPRRRLKPA